MQDTLKSINPATLEIVGEVKVTTESELTDIVTNAQQAFKSWRQVPLKKRVKKITAAFESLEPLHRGLAQLMSQEMGKDVRRSMGEVSGVIYGAAYSADDVAAALKPNNVGGDTVMQYLPLGICAVISPWNYPLAMAVNLIIPSLVAGNVVIFKPSEETPLVADEMVAALNEFLPQGILQIVHGGKELGQKLVESDVNLIAFTGSRQAGVDIMQRASSGLKRLIMELGGNDPMIVMANANIEAAAGFAVASSFENTGQMCVSTERVYVDAKIADAFEARVAEIASQYTVGPWNQSNVNIGPLVNKAQFQKVKSHIDDAVAKGAKVLLGASEQQYPYIPPTVITDITPDMLLENEETFGPVVAIARYENIDQAISRANDSDYGLGAVVFGGKGAADVAQQLEAGMVAVNQSVGGGANTPWVGAKQSGFGYRGSVEGHRQFAQVRVLSK
ncbi:MAG: aldehyde dehydrogenase [Gammaproteobacteria bacterium]|nr:aldehyde dehydrogenase [Gammaproteobacteria bacterium]